MSKSLKFTNSSPIILTFTPSIEFLNPSSTFLMEIFEVINKILPPFLIMLPKGSDSTSTSKAPGAHIMEQLEFFNFIKLFTPTLASLYILSNSIFFIFIFLVILTL